MTKATNLQLIKDRTPFKEVFGQPPMLCYAMYTFIVWIQASSATRCAQYGVKRTLVEHFAKFFNINNDGSEPTPLCLDMIMACVYHAHPVFKKRVDNTDAEDCEKKVASLKLIQSWYPKWSNSVALNVPDALQIMSEEVLWPYLFNEVICQGEPLDDDETGTAKKTRIFNSFCKFSRATTDGYTKLPSYSVYYENYKVFVGAVERFGLQVNYTPCIDKLNKTVSMAAYVNRIIKTFSISNRIAVANATLFVEDNRDDDNEVEHNGIDSAKKHTITALNCLAQESQHGGGIDEEETVVDDDGPPQKRVRLSSPPPRSSKRLTLYRGPSTSDEEESHTAAVGDDTDDEDESSYSALQALARFSKKDYQVAVTCQIESVSVLATLLREECQKY